MRYKNVQDYRIYNRRIRHSVSLLLIVVIIRVCTCISKHHNRTTSSTTNHLQLPPLPLASKKKDQRTPASH